MVKEHQDVLSKIIIVKSHDEHYHASISGSVSQVASVCQKVGFLLFRHECTVNFRQKTPFTGKKWKNLAIVEYYTVYRKNFLHRVLVIWRRPHFSRIRDLPI